MKRLQLKLVNLEKSKTGRSHAGLVLRQSNNRRSIEESIREDVALLKASPLIKDDTQIIGLAYDTATGALTEVEEGKSAL
jgi:carbonic anhydrase